jgi:hypothetical protein
MQLKNSPPCQGGVLDCKEREVVISISLSKKIPQEFYSNILSFLSTKKTIILS